MEDFQLAEIKMYYFLSIPTKVVYWCQGGKWNKTNLEEFLLTNYVDAWQFPHYLQNAYGILFYGMF